MADVLLQLEESARILLAPPTAVTSSQRHVAESVFIDFRRTKSPFNLCRHILENSKVDCVQFQAAVLLKEAIIREWALIPKADINSLKTYLLQYVVEKPELPPYVREQVVQTIAIVVKRSSIDGETADKEMVFNEVLRLINSGNTSLQPIGCAILSAMLNEYASTIKSSDVGLTWEVHFQAKKQFESQDLKRVYQFCLQVLYELEKCNDPSPEYFNFLRKMISIAEQILSWNFIHSNLPKKLIGIFEADQSPSLRPGAAWRDIFMDQNVVDLFFKLHWKIRSNQEIAHHSSNCLIQLASLHGTIFADRGSRPQYLSYFLVGLLKLMTSCTMGYDALSLANIISKMVLFFPPPILILVPKDILEAFLAELTKITCKFAEQSVEEENMHIDEYYSEAFSRLLEAWIIVFHDIQVFPEAYCKQAAVEILNTYLRCHLGKPEGLRNPVLVNDHEEVDESEDDDRTKYRDQLIVMGMFGRHSINHAVPVLTKLFEDRVTHLQTHLQNIHQQIIMPNDRSQLTTIFEDLHWLLLITGHIFVTDSEGESTLIPLEIMQFSSSQKDSVNLEITLKTLTSPRENVSNIPGAEQSCDSVIRLMAAIFRLTEVERQASAANLVHLLSPEVASSLMWFFRRWSVAYLLPNETYYSEISPSLNGAFGRDTESGRWCLNFLMGKVDTNLSTWTSEAHVVTDTIHLLLALVENKDRGNHVAKCETLWHLVRKHVSSDLGLLPPSAHRGLLHAFIVVGMVVPDIPSREQYWLQVLKPLQDRFKDLICQENFARTFHEERCKRELSYLLDNFIGVVHGCDTNNINYVFSFLHPIMSEFVSLLGVYHNYQDVVEQILEFLCECTKRMLCFLNQADTKRLYEICLSMIQTYAKFNTGKQTNDSSAEEDQYHDILLLMELLTNLLSKDFIDFSPLCSGAEEEGSVSAADITLYGLHIIMPMMNEELLKFPRLCLQYFKMITFVCEIYPEKICQLPEDLFKNLLVSIQLGLANYTSDIANLCLEFLSVLGIHTLKQPTRNPLVFEGLRPFLKIVMDLLLQNCDTELVQAGSTALFAMICCYQDYYQELVNNILRSQTDPIYYQRMVTAFSSLMEGVQLNEERPNKAKFKENFEKFVSEVRGFLCVK